MMKRMAFLTFFTMAGPAWAHHPLAGKPMESFADGLLSGLGHPVLGVEHLIFVLSVGALARIAGMPLRGIAAYLGAMLLGCLAVQADVQVPLREPMIALSLLLVGGVLAFQRPIAPWTTLTLFAGYGLFHGAAFGESIATQEGSAGSPVLMGYLTGLVVLQIALAFAAGLTAGRVLETHPDKLPLRMAGAMVAGVGVFLCLEAIEDALIGLILA